MQKFRKVIIALVALSMITGMLPVWAASAENEATRNVCVYRVSGSEVRSDLAGLERTTSLRLGQSVSEGQLLRTGAMSEVHLRVDTDSLVRMNERTELTVESLGMRLHSR